MEICGLVCVIDFELFFMKVGLIGFVFYYMKVCVVCEDGSDVMDGEVGEVIVRG